MTCLGALEARSFACSLAATDDTPVAIAAWFGEAPGDAGSTTLLLLLHGVTYDHRYWHMPGIDESYSFVSAARSSGFDCLAIDRLGVGQSSKPRADLVTMENQAHITRSIVDQVRAGALGKRYDKVVLVGHSFGSLLAIDTAATYACADGLVLTGFAHAVATSAPEGLIVPADMHAGLPPEQRQPGYLTTAEGRRSYFYNAANADPQVIAIDDRLRQTLTIGEMPGIQRVATDRALSCAIRVPVLTLIGAADTLFWPPDDGEDAWFTGATEHQTIVIPNAGHDLQLELSAPESTRHALEWLRRLAASDPDRRA